MRRLCPKRTLECGRTWGSKPVIGVLFRRVVIAAAACGLIAGCSLLGPPEPPPASQALYLVAHPEVALTRAEARDIYLGQTDTGEHAGVVPVENVALQGEFQRRLLKVKPEQYDKLWKRRAFRDGAVPPARLQGDAAVNEFVRKTPGAIGYVRAPGSRVKVLGKL